MCVLGRRTGGTLARWRRNAGPVSSTDDPFNSTLPGAFRSVLAQAGRTVPETNVPELNSAANRSSSKDRLSESSTHSLSGRGYSVSVTFPRSALCWPVLAARLCAPAGGRFNYVNESDGESVILPTSLLDD
ncbi:hypothetical protein MHYP_G00252500 [Metynnis hypsauchen]